MKKRDYGWLVSAPFFGVHVAAVVGVAMLGWSWTGFALAIGLYYLRMFGVTGGYHRYFAHRTYRTSRPFQFILAWLAQSSLQKGALWWAAHHRDHHKHSDTTADPHSFREYGFWYSHVGWILSTQTEETDFKKIGDLARYPELRWLNTWHVVPGVIMAVALYFMGGAHALVWGFFVSTSLLWHGTFSINSLAHWWGRRRYNNHHYYQRSASQGFFWWEIDLTFYILRALSAVGLVWDLHTPPRKVLEGNLEAGRRAKPATNVVINVVNAPVPILPTTVEPTAEAAAE